MKAIKKENMLNNGRHVVMTEDETIEYDIKDDQIIKTFRDGKPVDNPKYADVIIDHLIEYKMEEQRNAMELEEYDKHIKEEEQEKKKEERRIKKIFKENQKLDKKINKWEDRELADGEYKIALEDGTDNVFHVAGGKITDSYIQDHEGVQIEHFTQNELNNEKLQKSLSETIKNHEYNMLDGEHELERSDGSNNVIKVENGRVVGVSVQKGGKSKQIFSKAELDDPDLQYEFKKIMRLNEEREKESQVVRKIKPHEIQEEMDISL